MSIEAPFAKVSFGVGASLLLGEVMTNFSYHDVHHGSVDEISFTMSDLTGFLRGGLGLDQGASVSAAMGFQRFGGIVPCGTYEIGEVEAEGSSDGDTITFHALAAFTSKELRTDRSEAYDEMKLVAIVQKFADRHGLKLLGDIPDLTFKRITQEKQSDLVFLTRLADDWGCYFSIKGNLLVFTTRESVEAALPVRTFELVEGNRQTSWSARKSSKDLYPKATCKYLHPETGELVEASAEDPRITSGDTLKIEERAETKAHAERRCIAALARENDKYGTGSLTLAGDPLLVAGQVIQLGATYGRYAGRWLVVTADHDFGSGYTTTIQIKALT